MATPVIHTPRLFLRPVIPDDFDFVYRMQSDPGMMRYIRAAEKDPELIRERMAAWAEYMRGNPGLGVFTAFWRETNEPAGTGVLRHVDYKPGNELELGYLIAPGFWGQGLATEIAGALAEYAFASFPDPLVVAITAPENEASQKVLHKCGFRLRGSRFIYDADCLEFVLDRDARPSAAQ